jgi:hypothetical protein
VVASSRRTESRSPFDNGKPFRALELVADPPRQRVIFHVIHDNVKHPNNGTWEYSLKTAQFKKLLPMALFHPSEVNEGAFFMMGSEWGAPISEFWIGRLDLATDRFTLLVGKTPAGIEAQKPAGLPAEFSATFPEKTFHDGHIWSPFPFGRQPIQGGAPEFFQHVRGGLGLNAHFGDCLRAVGHDELLLGDWRGLYLVRLKQ